MRRNEPSHGRGLHQYQREQPANQRDLPPLAIRLAAIEPQQAPEDREEARVAQTGADRARDRAARRSAAAHEVTVQRHELLVRFARHDFVRADDAVAGSYDVLARVDALAQFVPPSLGLDRVENERSLEEVSREPDIELVADARPAVGLARPRAHEVLRVRQHLVARHRLFARSTALDQLRGLFDLPDARAGDTRGERAVE